MHTPKNPLLPPLLRGLEQSGTHTLPHFSDKTNPVVVSAASMITGKLPIVHVSSPPSQIPVVRPETVEGHIIAYYYAALTNVLCQVNLSPVLQPEDNDVIKSLIDSSYRDFHTIDAWFLTLDPNQILASPSSRSYHEVRDVWKPHLKDWRTVSRLSPGLAPQHGLAAGNLQP